MILACLPDPRAVLRGWSTPPSQRRSLRPPHLRNVPKGRTIDDGSGKAAAAMTCALESGWAGSLAGVVV